MRQAIVVVWSCWTLAVPAAAQAVSGSGQYREAFTFVERQLSELCHRTGDGYPYHTVDGEWKFSDSSGWTAGYFPGMLWMLYGQTEDPLWLERARRWTEPIAAFRNDDRDLNFGLLFVPTFVVGSRLDPRGGYREIALLAAEAMARRYMPKGKYIRSWGRVGDPDQQAIIIIDCLIDLHLFYWAAEETADKRYAEMATNHARVTVETAIRENGSSVQVMELDPLTGKKVRDRHKQAYSKTSCWSRGQAFGIYALVEVFQYTRNRRFLAAAKKMAGYWMEHVPDDWIPYWDFDAPNIPHEPRDSSAAAMAAGGLWELAGEVEDTALGQRYRQAALKTLESLTRHYLASGKTARNGRILLHATLHRPAGIAVDESLILGDYYYLELLLKVMNAKDGL